MRAPVPDPPAAGCARERPKRGYSVAHPPRRGHTPPMTALTPARRASIQCAADTLLAGAGARTIDFGVLLLLCREAGIDVLDADLRDIAGALRREGEGWRIYLNREDGPGRRYFTLAHALGHYALHAEEGRAFAESRFTRPLTPGADDGGVEREANEFAACLVMPAAMIHALLAGRPPTERQVVDLSGRCGVSPLAMAHRFGSLGYAVPLLPTT